MMNGIIAKGVSASAGCVAGRLQTEQHNGILADRQRCSASMVCCLRVSFAHLKVVTHKSGLTLGQCHGETSAQRCQPAPDQCWSQMSLEDWFPNEIDLRQSKIDPSAEFSRENMNVASINPIDCADSTDTSGMLLFFARAHLICVQFNYSRMRKEKLSSRSVKHHLFHIIFLFFHSFTSRWAIEWYSIQISVIKMEPHRNSMYLMLCGAEYNGIYLKILHEFFLKAEKVSFSVRFRIIDNSRLNAREKERKKEEK